MNDTRIKVTYIIDMIGWAGAQTHLISVLHNIDYDKFNISVVCLRRAGTQFDLLKKLPVTTLVCDLENLMNPVKTLITIFKVRKFIKENNTDILQSYMFNPNLMASLISYLPGRKYKLITTRRDTGYWHQRHHWWLYKFMNVVTDKIIAVSSEVKCQSIAKENISNEKIITIYNGINTEIYNKACVDRESCRKKFDIKNDEFVIGILAAIRPEKRHDVFINAASKVVKEIPNARFMIVGDGDETVLSQIKQLINTHNLQDKFLLTGKLTDVISVLTVFDVSVLCSDTEGMSNTILQSISMGRATIVSNVGGNPEVINNGVNGLVFPAGDSGKLAELIVQIHNDVVLKGKLEKQAAITASEKFSIKPIIKSLQDVYVNILSNN